MSETFNEDLIANAILGVCLVVAMAFRDVCKRIAHSNCRYGEHGLDFSLPTWRGPERDEENAL